MSCGSCCIRWCWGQVTGCSITRRIELPLELADCHTYDNGVVSLTYQRTES